MVAKLDPDETARMHLVVDQQLLSCFFNILCEILLSLIASGDTRMFNYLVGNLEEAVTVAADRFREENQMAVN